jgi:hypothetical protein
MYKMDGGELQNAFIGLGGRLGNVLFQVAVLFIHCKKHNYNPIVLWDIRSSCNRNYIKYCNTILHKIKNNIYQLNSNQINHIVSLHKDSMFTEIKYTYSNFPSNIKYLSGYFQAFSYIKDDIDMIKDIFVNPPVIQKYIKDNYNDSLLKDISDTVVIHVRRTDYILSPDVFGWLSNDYYIRSMEIMRQKLGKEPKWVIFSDDIPWCKDQSIFKDAYFVEEKDEIVSFELMIQFENYIIPNSSYSWWATILGVPYKHVCAPPKWFYTSPEEYCNILYPDDWIRVKLD